MTDNLDNLCLSAIDRIACATQALVRSLDRSTLPLTDLCAARTNLEAALTAVADAIEETLNGDFFALVDEGKIKPSTPLPAGLEKLIELHMPWKQMVARCIRHLKRKSWNGGNFTLSNIEPYAFLCAEHRPNKTHQTPLNTVRRVLQEIRDLGILAPFDRNSANKGNYRVINKAALDALCDDPKWRPVCRPGHRPYFREEPLRPAH